MDKPNAFGPNHTQGISWKAVVFAVVLIPLNIYWIAVTEMVWSGLHFTAVSLPLNVIFILFCFIGYNAVARRISPQLAFSQNDLLVIYIILATSSAVAGYDSLVGLIGVLPHTAWFATPENDWGNLFAGHLPTWLIITNREAVRDFYVGEVDFYGANYWQYWLIPAISWTFLVLIITVLLLCTHRPPAPSLDRTGETDLSHHTVAPFDEQSQNSTVSQQVVLDWLCGGGDC